MSNSNITVKLQRQQTKENVIPESRSKSVPPCKRIVFTEESKSQWKSYKDDNGKYLETGVKESITPAGKNIKNNIL